MTTRTDLIEKAIAEVLTRIPPHLRTREEALKTLARYHDHSGGFFELAKSYGVLENNSAEEFSVQFYTAYNNEIGLRY